MTRFTTIVATLAFLFIVELASAGRLQGPSTTATSVNARSQDSYNVIFRANQKAIIAVEGDGDTDLDLYVYDENGNLVASDADNTDFCVVEFQPRWTGTFTILVKNRGTVYNRYTIITN